MALYEFKCEGCGKINVESMSITTKKQTTVCDYCGAIARRIISKNSFILKGKRWSSKEGY